jgi:hypothetical protein
MTDSPEAVYLVRIVLRDATDEGASVGPVPTNAQMEAALEALVRTEFPDFTAVATSERVDR